MKHPFRCSRAVVPAVLVAAILLAGAVGRCGAAVTYAVAKLPTPVFNVPDFDRFFGGDDGKTVVTDRCGQFRQLEFVALPGTVFQILATVPARNGSVYRVTTGDYPHSSKTGFYVDARFVAERQEPPPERKPQLPSREEVVDRLLQARGSIYVWGGNTRSGIEEMRRFYPAASGAVLSSDSAKRWELQGVDCSGLLYEATDGFTPRNTAALVNFGSTVSIAGLTTEQIIGRVEPLDLIVWNGHVLIILDRERVIESHLECKGGKGGVRVRPLGKTLSAIREKRVPLDEWSERSGRNGFVIRRWYATAQRATKP